MANANRIARQKGDWATLVSVEEPRKWSPGAYRAAVARGVDGKRVSFEALREMCAEYVDPSLDDELSVPTHQTFWAWSVEGSKGPEPWLMALIAYVLDISVEDLTRTIRFAKPLDRSKAKRGQPAKKSKRASA